MSYYSRKSYAASGTGPYSVPFGYIQKTHVEVYLDGEETLNFTWPTAGQILLDEDPGAVTILIMRNTPKDARLVDFTDGSILTESNLDMAYTQDFYIVQETMDLVSDGPLDYYTDGKWDFSNTQVSVASGHGIPEPTVDGHIATKKYVDDTFSETVIEGYKTATYNYMLKAQKWAVEDEDVEVETGKYSAKHWMLKAEDEKIAAAGSATDADGSATDAAGSAADALTQAGTAETHANQAKSYMDSLALPEIQAGDAEKILEVNVAEDGYDLVVNAGGAVGDKIEEGDSLVEVVDAGSGYIIHTVDTAEIMRLTATGVGIGTNNPNALFHVAGAARVDGNLNVGSTVAETGASITLSRFASGNRVSYIDFRGDDTYTDFALRILREAYGPNSISVIAHRGTGSFILQTTDAASLLFRTNNVTRMTVQSDGKLALGLGAAINEFSIDGTLVGNSDLAVPTEKAVKAYADTKASSSHTHVESDITDLDHDAVKLQGRTLDSVAPTDGQVVTWDNANTKWKPVSPSSHTHVESDITDLDHDAVKLQGRTLDSAAPSDGQVVTWDNANTKWKPVSPSGGGYSSRVRAYNGNAQSIPSGTTTKLVLPTELFDGLNEFDSTTNYRFTATNAGYYLAIGNVAMESPMPDGCQVDVFLFKNAATYASWSKGVMGGISSFAMETSSIIYLAVNDYIEFKMAHNAGSSKNTCPEASGVYLAIHRLS